MKKHSGYIVPVFCTVLITFGFLWASVPEAWAATASEPLVAIHVSEHTQALETLPAVFPTPVGPGTSGKQWWISSWHYFVGIDLLKEALRSDGTPFVEISDSDIAAGKLRSPDGSPRYPILISLASEAIHANEVGPLRDYVNAGGFMLIGSSSFTRNPDGTSRGNFALASEMGVRMAIPGLLNWYENKHFTKTDNNWLISHIPSGQLVWRAPLTSNEIPSGVSPAHTIHNAHPVWHVVTNGALVLAEGDQGPLLTLKQYGQGYIVYHGALQPLLGHSGFDTSMYAYLIYRKTIDLAFQILKAPMVRVNPWRYPYDAALLARHDFEHRLDLIQAIEASAQFEKAAGAKGEYYFSTGALRSYSDLDKESIISSLRSAVSSYGATIGSHNGGLPNPVNPALLPSDYDYWHWGADEALDTIMPGYASGREYAKASILASFQDIEGWLNGLDNGRAGCGADNSCPRVWVSPAFNTTRDASKEILEELHVATVGEQKVAPFPHWTVSYATQGKQYTHLSLPVSEWYGTNEILQDLDAHYVWTMRAGVDLYYDLGGLINFYGHALSNNGGVQQDYITYAMTKPRIWPSNALDLYDWWKLRSSVHITPSFSANGDSYTLDVAVSGATDPETAIEVAIPPAYGSEKYIYLDGRLATASDYRAATLGTKIRVGSSVTSVRIQNRQNEPPTAINDSYSTDQNTALNIPAPGLLANDTDRENATLTAQLVTGPGHGTLELNSNGSFIYTPTTGYSGSDSFTYTATDGDQTSNSATVSISVAATPLFSDDLSRSSSPPELSPWIVQYGTWTVTSATLQGLGSPTAYYGYAYVAPTPLWTDYSLQARIQFPVGSYGGGLGGRLNPATGAHYGVWVYPGSSTMKLVKFSDWTSWSGNPMGQASLTAVGTGWHTLKMVFSGNRVQVYYDGTVKIDVTDNSFDSRAAYLSGGISVDMATLPGYSGSYGMAVDDLLVNPL